MIGGSALAAQAQSPWKHGDRAVNATQTGNGNEGANVLMYDGHVEYRTKTEVFFYNANGSRNNNKNNDLWVAYR